MTASPARDDQAGLAGSCLGVALGDGHDQLDDLVAVTQELVAVPHDPVAVTCCPVAVLGDVLVAPVSELLAPVRRLLALVAHVMAMLKRLVVAQASRLPDTVLVLQDVDSGVTHGDITLRFLLLKGEAASPALRPGFRPVHAGEETQRSPAGACC